MVDKLKKWWHNIDYLDTRGKHYYKFYICLE